MDYGLGDFKRLALCVAFLLLVPLLARSATSVGRMESVSVSPDGNFLAVDFVKGETSFIYRISVDTGLATRLTGGEE